MEPLRSVRRRPFGVRLYLAVAFAAVALITAGLAYLLVSDTGEQAADEELTQIAIGRTVSLADEIGNRPRAAPPTTLAGITEQGYSAWVFDADGRLITTKTSRGVELLAVPGARGAVQAALIGSRYVDELPGGVTVVAVPIFREGAIDGAILGRSVRVARGPGGDRVAARRPPDRARRRGRGRDPGLVPDRERDHLAGQAARRQRRADQRGRARRAARGRRRARRDHRPRPGAGDACAAPCARPSAPCARSATGSRRSSRRSRDAVMVVQPDGEVRFSNAAAARPDRRRRPGDRAAGPVAAPRGAASGGRERRAARRRPRLLAQRAPAAGRGRGAGGRPRPHRGAAPRGRRARVRLQRRARAAQPDRRHLGRDRGPARRRQGRPRGARALPLAGSPRTPSGSAG